MNYLKHFPVGTAIPDSIHSVCTSLPTMADVIGYEEKNPETLEALKTGYPRFLIHKYVRQVGALLVERLELGRGEAYPVVSSRAAREMVRFVGEKECAFIEDNDFPLVHVPSGDEHIARAKAYLQHTGAAVSSRRAEDWLCSQCLLDAPQVEDVFSGDGADHVRRFLSDIYRDVSPDDVLLCNSGMNAFYAAFQAVNAIQAAEGRDVWVQLGWLYLDTGKILSKFSADATHHIEVFNVFDLSALERVFAEHGKRIAGLVTEVPTNPLIQTCDIARVHEITAANGVALVVDPTLATPYNIDVLGESDLAVNSLTKFAANQGDVMSGALVLNRESPFYDRLKELLPALVEPPYERDLQRLAFEIEQYPALVRKMNRNTTVLAEFLESRASVKKVFWAYEEQSRAYYEKIARRPESPGGMLTIYLNKPLKEFYDPARIVKGPSFGTFFTMMCPFMYLAHYDLVGTAEGRRYLQSLNLDPDLVRISVGIEESDDIIEAFSEVL